MRTRIKHKQMVYVSSAGKKKGVVCHAPQSVQDKHTLLWERIQSECRHTTGIKPNDDTGKNKKVLPSDEMKNKGFT